MKSAVQELKASCSISSQRSLRRPNLGSITAVESMFSGVFLALRPSPVFSLLREGVDIVKGE